MTDKSAHTNCAGPETTPLTIITKSLGPKVFAVGGSQPFRRSGACLDGTTSHPPIIHPDKIINTIDRWGHGDCNIYLESLERLTEIQRGGFGRSSDESIGMNPPGTIVSNRPHFNRHGIFDFFSQETSHFINRSVYL